MGAEMVVSASLPPTAVEVAAGAAPTAGAATAAGEAAASTTTSPRRSKSHQPLSRAESDTAICRTTENKKSRTEETQYSRKQNCKTVENKTAEQQAICVTANPPSASQPAVARGIFTGVSKRPILCDIRRRMRYLMLGS